METEVRHNFSLKELLHIWCYSWQEKLYLRFSLAALQAARQAIKEDTLPGRLSAHRALPNS